MKIFIAGARSIQTLDDYVKDNLLTAALYGYQILVGDCIGVDSAVQKFYYYMEYRNVTVYASGNKVRNNIGSFEVRNIAVPNNITGFDFYAEKDKAMSLDCDVGFMIWDGESRGTFTNIANLAKLGKPSDIYIVPENRALTIKTVEDLKALSRISKAAQRLYEKLFAVHTN